MKDAYSPLYQEFLDAFQVGYEQMAGLQIVCPCCNEPVFRVERSTTAGPTAYFSHYAAPEGLSVLDCERRVAGMPSTEKEERNQAARNQSLAVFRAVLRDAVAPIPIKGRLLSERDKSWLPSDMIMNGVTLAVRHFATTTDRQSIRKLTFRNSQRMLSLRGAEINPNAKPSIRSSIAADLFISAFSDYSHRTAMYLVARSMADCFQKSSEWPHKSIFHGRARTMEVAIWNHFPDRSDRDVFAATLVTVDFILRELERLPFEKMIINARNGRKPMEGVTIDDYLEPETDPEFKYALHKLDKEKVMEFDRVFATKSGKFEPAGDSLRADDGLVDDLEIETGWAEDDRDDDDLNTGPRM
jgi:hypothetical protein